MFLLFVIIININTIISSKKSSLREKLSFFCIAKVFTETTKNFANTEKFLAASHKEFLCVYYYNYLRCNFSKILIIT